MNNSIFIHICDHARFFEKWLRYTKSTSINAFASDYGSFQTIFKFLIKIIENAIDENGASVTINALKANQVFVQVIESLVEKQLHRTDMSAFMLTVKLFRQCVMEMIGESEIKDCISAMDSIGKVFDAVELISFEKFHQSVVENLTETLHKVLIEQLDERPPGLPLTVAKLANLSKTEFTICEYIVSKLSTKEISEQLNVSIETIQTHRKKIRKKLGVSNRSNLYTYLKCLF